MITPTPKQPKKRTHNHDETNIQIECIRAFRSKYPELSKLLFSVPNENEQSKYEGTLQQKITGNRRRRKGVTAGVSDLLLLVAKKGYHGLCLECKTPIGHQSKNQKEWEQIEIGRAHV